MNEHTVMNMEQLAELLHYTPKSLKFKLYTNPDSLPPRIKGMKKPLWLAKVVYAWLENSSRPQVKVGRPRKNVY